MRCSRLALLALLFSPSFSAFQQGLPAAKDRAGFENRVKELLAGKELYLRERVNSSPKVYFAITDSSEIFFVHEEGRLVNLWQKVKVRITGVEYHRTQKRVRVKFKHHKLGKGAIDFYWVKEAAPTVESMKEMIRMAFCETEQDDHIILYVGNRKSKQLHFIGCNHLPEFPLQERFSRLDAAVDRGYGMCNLCFSRNILLKDLDLEMYLSSLITTRMLSNSRVNVNDSINDLVRRAGEKVLNNWPTALRGYKYRFAVLDDKTVNACAAPGGRIYINNGLLEAIETENELIGIMAHEIAHVERRHGLRRFRKGKSLAFWTKLAALAADVGISMSGSKTAQDIADLYSDMIEEATRLAHEIVLSGYSRDYECEADFYAIAFMNTMGDRRSYGNMMRKLQYQSNVRGSIWQTGKVFSSHPDIDQRIQFADNAEVSIFSANTGFIGYSSSAQKVAEVRFEAQCATRAQLPVPKEETLISNWKEPGFQRYETVAMYKLFATISTTEEIKKARKIKEIKVVSGGKVRKLDNREDTTVSPLHEVGCTFESDSGELLGEIDGIDLKLDNVAYWEKM